MIRRYVPNLSTRDGRRRLVVAASTVLFGFVVAGAVTFAVGVTAIVARHMGVYPAVTVAGAVTFAYAAAGMLIVDEYT